MQRVEAQRTDVFSVVGLPYLTSITHEQYLSQSIAVLVADLKLYRRAPDAGLPRVMIVGDSQALSLGYGIGQWAQQEKRANVWNHGIEGCGLAVDGNTRVAGLSSSETETCRNAARAWPSQVAAYRPGIVIVLSSISDIQERKLPGETEFRSLGDPVFDDFLVQQYIHAVDALSSRGAHVVWMTAPCVDPHSAAATFSHLETAHTSYLDTKILPRLEKARPDRVTLFDLSGVVCPGGHPLESIAGVGDLRPDGVHFSVKGSEWFAAKYGDKVLALGGQ